MKKFLLFISCLLALGGTSAYADSYSWTTSSGSNVFTSKNGDTAPANFESAELNGATWTLSCENKIYLGANWSGKNGANWKGLQFGKKSSSALPFSIATDYFNDKTISQIKINASGATTVNLTINVGGTEFGTTALESSAANGTEYTFTGSASGNLEISYSGTTTAAVYWRSIEVTYTSAPVTPPAVATPEISIDENDMVSISCETEGVDIYYTINGDEPTADSQKYDAPFELTATATVKAIAINGEDKSNIASKTFTVIEKKNTLENWTEWSQTGTFKITCPLTVVYKNGKNVYVKDADNNYALVFNQNNITLPDYQNGDVIKGMTATFTIYAASQLPEIIPVTVGETTAGTPVEATEITAADVNEDNFFHFVSMSGVSIVAAAQDRNFTITDKDGIDAPMFNQFNLAFTPEEGATYDVTGVIGAYKGT
ncbi:MAG: chitobiase/beta-hexosaminidase C-terminal domain-containing protein, partial [Duncaniella sp.]|nr:chitobiase/beta-hexosaminidase C-terminal domain-containing protein [Duncaniella sp.]